MKSSTLPPLRVAPKLRKAAESVLHEGETLSAFVLDAVQTTIHHRRAQADFVARGLASEERAEQHGHYVSADEVLRKLRKRIESATARKSPARKRKSA